MRISRLFSVFAVLLAAVSVAAPRPAEAAVDLSVSVNLFAPPPVAIAPPPLPVYVVPQPPLEGYVWIPGHWLWASGGYFWVPGTWVAPPALNVVWTPGYWGWGENAFVWHEGYWGPHVGFYGGVVYGGGYDGVGFVGGSWSGGHYVVNRQYVNVVNVTNVSNVSFNGGPGGITARANAQQEAFAHEHHMQMTQDQIQHVQAASRNPAFLDSANHGKPAVAATPHAGNFAGAGIEGTRAAGQQSMEARQHNAAIRQNPSLAGQAAVPHQYQQHQDQPRPSQPRPANVPHAPTAPARPQAAAPHHNVEPAAPPHELTSDRPEAGERERPEGGRPEGSQGGREESRE